MKFKKQNPIMENLKKEEDDLKIVHLVRTMFEDSYAAKSEKHTEWDMCSRAYDGSLFKANAPAYISKEVSNYVFSTIESIKPVMLAGNPKILAMPQKQDQKNFTKSEQVQFAIDAEWLRTSFFKILVNYFHAALVYGKSIMAILWDAKKDHIGQVKPLLISPFNFFIDRMATSMDDAEYAGYAIYKSPGELKQAFPQHAEEIDRQAKEPENQYLFYGKDVIPSITLNERKLLYIEVYMRDYSTMFEDKEQEDGTILRTTYMKYPRGRRIIVAEDILLEDGENPYEDGEFPFVELGCYEDGTFWSSGEVKNIISPTRTSNTLKNQILDNARTMGNGAWVVDKNCGVAKGSITNEPGLVIRKNPGTEVRREQPPAFPSYIFEAARMSQQDVEVVSGVFDVTRGEKPVGVTAAAALQALNEQAQGRIRLKVQLSEDALSKIGAKWYKRMQQFWVTPRTVRYFDAYKKPQFITADRDFFDGDFDIMISAGSTMAYNKTARFSQYIQLSQTPAEDGLPMLDRRAVLEISDIPDVGSIVDRIEKRRVELQKETIRIQQETQLKELEAQMAMQQQNAALTAEANANSAQQQQAMATEQSVQQNQAGLNAEAINAMGINPEVLSNVPPDVVNAFMEALKAGDTDTLTAIATDYPDLSQVLESL